MHSFYAKNWTSLRDLSKDMDVNRLPCFHAVNMLPHISRDREIAATVKYFYNRFKNRKQKGSGEPREKNHYVATQGGPGTGKSYFLWNLAVLSPNDLKFSKEDVKHYPNVGEFIQQWIPIPISFNQTTTFCKEKYYDSDVILGFALRLLYSFLFANPEIDPVQFELFTTLANPTFQHIGLDRICTEVLKFIRKTAAQSNPHRQRPLLLIDEIMTLPPATSYFMRLVD